MNRILRALTVVLLFELGALLLYLPWSAFWEQNYFLSHYPWIMHFALHPATRGIVSGIGVLDIFVGFGFFNSRPVPARVPPPPTRKPLLCYVTDRRSLAGAPALATELQLQKIEQAAKAGVDWIQIREKDLSGRQLAKLTEQAILRAGDGSTVLVNDRVDVAIATGASGVHLGEQSLPPMEVRELISQRLAGGKFLLGASMHSLKGAVEAEQAEADYVIFGPVYSTPSKTGFGPPQGIQRLGEVCQRLTIPVLAIGGITLENAVDVMAAGAAGIAAIRLFQDAGNLDDLVRELRKIS